MSIVAGGCWHAERGSGPRRYAAALVPSHPILPKRRQGKSHRNGYILSFAIEASAPVPRRRRLRRNRGRCRCRSRLPQTSRSRRMPRRHRFAGAARAPGPEHRSCCAPSRPSPIGCSEASRRRSPSFPFSDREPGRGAFFPAYKAGNEIGAILPLAGAGVLLAVVDREGEGQDGPPRLRRAQLGISGDVSCDSDMVVGHGSTSVLRTDEPAGRPHSDRFGFQRARKSCWHLREQVQSQSSIT